MKPQTAILSVLFFFAAFGWYSFLLNWHDAADQESMRPELFRHPYLDLPSDRSLVVADNPVVLVGRVAAQEYQRATFRITNRGRREVRVRPYNAPCPGTYLDRGEQTIAPGETGEIRVGFHFRNSSPNEDVEFPFRIATDDPASPWIELAVIGRPL